MATNGLALPSGTAPHLPAASASVTVQEMDSLVREVRSASLYNRQLSSICQVNGLKSTGVKAELQKRITDLIAETYHAQDGARFYQVRQSILNAQNKGTTPQKPAPGRAAPYPNAPGMPASNGYSYGSHYSSNAALNFNGRLNGLPDSYSQLTFHPSPFYEVEAQITSTRECTPMPHNRHTVQVSVRLSDKPMLHKCLDDSSYRVMLFCAGPDTSGVQHVSFPPQTEIKVNGGEVKANTRGLKNKPGSTKPVDITSALRLKPTYVNNVDFTFALTKHKYHMTLKLCKIKTVEDLVKIARERQRISKESVIAEINKKNSDPDIEATSTVLDLRCPLSYMRLDVPVRGTKCSHIQCFDLTSYLQLQEQGPQWSCPVCSKPTPFEQLAVDEYVKDILRKTSKSTEQIVIHTDGQWSIKTDDDATNQGAQASSSVTATALDDDEVQISGVNELRAPKRETPQEPTPMRNLTPARPSSSTSTPNGPRGLGSTSSKRPAPPVIDLTLSDSDDDEPLTRPNKRQNTNTNGFRGSMGGYGL